MIPDAVRPIIGRLLGAWVPAIVMWLGSLGLDWITGEMVQTMIELGVGLTIYALTHKSTDAKVNPGDTASVTLAVASKSRRDILKRVGE